MSIASPPMPTRMRCSRRSATDLNKKFGAKGGAVVEGNLTVIKEGVEATKKVDYNDAAFLAVEKEPAAASRPHGRGVGGHVPGDVARPPTASSTSEYYEEMTAAPFRDGTIAEAPVLPGTGMFMPAGSAALKDKGLFRRNVPEFNADLCTGCMECAVVCPDAAIPNTVHDIRDLMSTAITPDRHR